METLNDIFEENGITRDDIAFHEELIHEIKKNADAIPDYRHPNMMHLVSDIVMIVFFALLGNANEWGEIEKMQNIQGKNYNRCRAQKIW